MMVRVRDKGRLVSVRVRSPSIVRARDDPMKVGVRDRVRVEVRVRVTPTPTPSLHGIEARVQ